MIITAKHQDGTPVREGDKVLAIWDNGRKSYGRIVTIGKPMRFADHDHAELQTYTIRCPDSHVRPAHARHIKYVRPLNPNRPQKEKQYA